MSESLCPCGSLASYPKCCGPFIAGERAAPTPEAMMRSRYTAFCKNDLVYLKKTWSPETYPEDLGSEPPLNWIRLEIIEAWEEGDEGEVEFKASFIHDHKLEVLHELSFFDKIDGQWLYYSGDFDNGGKSEKPKKIAKSDPCPCGSKLTYKQCHMKG